MRTKHENIMIERYTSQTNWKYQWASDTEAFKPESDFQQKTASLA